MTRKAETSAQCVRAVSNTLDANIQRFLLRRVSILFSLYSHMVAGEELMYAAESPLRGNRREETWAETMEGFGVQMGCRRMVPRATVPAGTATGLDDITSCLSAFP